MGEIDQEGRRWSGCCCFAGRKAKDAEPKIDEWRHKDSAAKSDPECKIQPREVKKYEEGSDAAEKAKWRAAKMYFQERDVATKKAEKRVRNQLQRKVEDIPIYTIGADCQERSFHSLAIKRYERLWAIRSTKLYGKPVTPPPLLQPPSQLCEEIHTYHIVTVIGKDELWRHSSVSFMFRETMYFVAFTPYDLFPSTIWFTFSDSPIPSYLNQMKLKYDCSYSDFTIVPVGYGCLNRIVEILSKVSPETVEWKDNKRSEALHCTCLMLSETMRSGALQLQVKYLLRARKQACIPQFDSRVHNWGKIGRCGFLHECDDILALAKASKIISGLYNPEKNRFEIWKLIGRRSPRMNKVCCVGKGLGIGLLITLFDKEITENYMVNKKVAYLIT